jgi:hypothetical protein
VSILSVSWESSFLPSSSRMRRGTKIQHNERSVKEAKRK